LPIVLVKISEAVAAVGLEVVGAEVEDLEVEEVKY